jgi:hypothetical protein
MFDAATPTPLAYQLPADAYRHLVRTLRLTLPPPPDDSPEALVRRDHAAIACVAGLAPANAAEARLAAQFVAASEQWNDCLRLAQLPETTPEWAAKCRAQAATMMRQSNSALRLLLRMQEVREKREATNAGCDRAAAAEHIAISLMAEALSPRPHPDPLPEGEGEGAAPPFPVGEGEAAAPPLPLGEGGAGEGSAGEAGGIARGGWGEGEAVHAVIAHAPTPKPQPPAPEP